MIRYKSTAKGIIEQLCFITMCVAIFLGIFALEAKTFTVKTAYTTETTVTHIDYHHEFGNYGYKVYAVDKNGKVYSDYISEDEYAILKAGDKANFEVIESTSFFGEKTTSKCIV